MASRALLYLSVVPKIKLTVFENERSAALHAAYFPVRSPGIYSGVLMIPPFTNGFSKKTLSNFQWDNLNAKINDISQIDTDAGKIALKMVTDYFDIPVATNSVSNP